jgi:hypothetical protein
MLKTKSLLAAHAKYFCFKILLSIFIHLNTGVKMHFLKEKLDKKSSKFNGDDSSNLSNFQWLGSSAGV